MFADCEFSNERKYIQCMQLLSKHLKKSNAACFYTPIVLKILIIV